MRPLHEDHPERPIRNTKDDPKKAISGGYRFSPNTDHVNAPPPTLSCGAQQHVWPASEHRCGGRALVGRGDPVGRVRAAQPPPRRRYGARGLHPDPQQLR